eukprot:scpid41406/ scgid16238/ Poly [ADP-ribose] polymerase 14; Collaborator of STAT6
MNCYVILLPLKLTTRFTLTTTVRRGLLVGKKSKSAPKRLLKSLKRALPSIHPTTSKQSGGAAAATSYGPDNQQQPAIGENVSIFVEQGSIAKCSTNAIVNPCGPDLVMSASGAASQTIIQTAGKGLQSDCSVHVRTHGSVAIGKFHVTRGYNLTATTVYHCVLPQCNNAGDDKEMGQLIGRILRHASKHNISSIAFPSLDAGRNAFPPRRSAELLIGAARQFARENPNTSVQRIVLCIHDEVVLSQFRTVAGKLLTTHAGDTPSDGVSRVLTLQPGRAVQPGRDVVRFQPTHKDTAQRTSTALARSTDKPSCPVQVSVKSGDITQENVDIIVITAMPDLRMQSAMLSKIVAQKAGNTVQAALDKVKSSRIIRCGQVCSTPGGKLPCKFIIHAVMEYAARTMYPRDFLKSLVSECLVEADRLNCNSIAFPALGAGGLGFSTSDCADSILAAIAEHAAKRDTSKELKSISLVIFQDACVQVFMDAIKHYPALTAGSAANVSSSMAVSENPKRKHSCHETPSPVSAAPAKMEHVSRDPGASKVVRAQEEIRFRLLGSSSNAVRDAKADVNRIVGHTLTCRRVDDEDLHLLSQDDHGRIRKQAGMHDVVAVFSGTASIHLYGRKAEVAAVESQILQLCVTAWTQAFAQNNEGVQRATTQKKQYTRDVAWEDVGDLDSTEV